MTDANTIVQRTPGPEVLNLGCGKDYRPAAWNVDISGDVQADERYNLQETPWPWNNNAFQRIIARHVLEHLNPVPWSELERVLAEGGTLKLTYPIGHTRYEDVTHEQYWNWNSARMLSGERAHDHEAVLPNCTLLTQDLTWNISPPDPLAEYRTRWKLWRYGPGPWLSQVPGLYGHVTAEYRHKTGGSP